MKTFKCAYNQCKYNKEVNEDVAVKKGSRYYHLDCLKESQNKNEIRKLFLEKINATEVVSGLNRTINNIVDVKGISSEFLLYALRYVINNKLPLNHAAGLYYIINNSKIKDSYQKEKSKIVAKTINDNLIQDIKTEKEVSFKIKKDEDTGWDKILPR
jgi:hypothetical protein